MNAWFIKPLYSIQISALIIVAAACAPSPRRYGQNQNTLQAIAASQAAAKTELERIDTFAQSKGYHQVGSTIQAQLAQFGVTSYASQIEKDECYLFVGLADNAVDLNLVVTDFNGQTIGYDVQPHAHPWVSVCNVGDTWLQTRILMQRGSGPFTYAVFSRKAEGDAISLAELWNSTDVAGSTQVVATGATMNSRVSDLDQRLANQGYRRVEQPRGMRFQANVDQTFQISLVAGMCYLFAGLGEKSLGSLTLAVEKDSKRAVAKQSSNDGESLVEYCTDKAGVFTLRAGTRESGEVFVTAYTKLNAGHGEATTTNVSSTPDTPPAAVQTTTFSDVLNDSLRLGAADMQARGYVPYGEAQRGSLVGQGHVQLNAQTKDKACWAIVLYTNVSQGIDTMRLVQARGASRAPDPDSTMRRALWRVCTDQAQANTVDLGAGSEPFQYALQTFRWPRGTQGPFGLKGIVYLRLAEATSMLNADGYQPDPAFGIERGNVPRQGAVDKNTVQLESGHCYALLAVGDEGIRHLTLTLKTAKGEDAAHSTNARVPYSDIRFCPKQSGDHILSVSTLQGSGKYVSQVFRR